MRELSVHYVCMADTHFIGFMADYFVISHPSPRTDRCPVDAMTMKIIGYPNSKTEFLVHADYLINWKRGSRRTVKMAFTAKSMHKNKSIWFLAGAIIAFHAC